MVKPALGTWRMAFGWLKLIFGILAAVDISLIARLAQNYGKASWVLILAVVGPVFGGYGSHEVNCATNGDI